MSRYRAQTSPMLLLARVLLGFLALTPYSGVGAELKVYFGNLHSHTSYSDGSGTPRDAFKHARDVAKLDFLAITEHNHAAADGTGDRKDGKLIATNHALYNGSSSNSLISAATSYNQTGRFVALYGQEFSTISKGNHINVFEVADVIEVPNGQFDVLFGQWLSAHPPSDGGTPLVQLNHPRSRNSYPDEYGLDDYTSEEAWRVAIDQFTCLIEILNGPALKPSSLDGRAGETFESAYLTYLNLGLHVAPTGNQDNHYKSWGSITDVRTGVITDELSKPKILEALRQRHVYATDDKNLRVIARVNGGLMGDRITQTISTGSAFDIQYSISDDDEPNASYAIQIYRGTIGAGPASESNEVVQDGNTPVGATVKIEDVQYTGGQQYVFLKIVQTNEDGPNDRVWTAPVWFESAVSPDDGSQSAEVASKKSSVYHVSLQCRNAQQIKESNRVFGEEAKKGRRLHEGCPR